MGNTTSSQTKEEARYGSSSEERPDEVEGTAAAQTPIHLVVPGKEEKPDNDTDEDEPEEGKDTTIGMGAGTAAQRRDTDAPQRGKGEPDVGSSAGIGSIVSSFFSRNTTTILVRVKNKIRHPASVPPKDVDPTPEGSFAGMPSEIATLIAGYLKPQEVGRVLETSTELKKMFTPARKYDVFIEYLRKPLRNKNPETPDELKKYCDSDSELINIGNLPPAFREVVENIQKLFLAYQAYFEHFLAMHQQYEDGSYATWPTEGMEELGCLFAGVKEKEAALPIKLIQGTGLGVIQATAKYVNRFASMVNENKFNWDELDRLTVQGLGGAQKAAGDSIVDLYFRGDSMTEVSIRSLTSWAGDLNPKLGSKWWLLIYNGRPTARARRSLGAASWVRGAQRGWPAARNSLSLIKVLTAKLDLSLRREAACADENDQALPSP